MDDDANIEAPAPPPAGEGIRIMTFAVRAADMFVGPSTLKTALVDAFTSRATSNGIRHDLSDPEKANQVASEISENVTFIEVSGIG